MHFSLFSSFLLYSALLITAHITVFCSCFFYITVLQLFSLSLLLLFCSCFFYLLHYFFTCCLFVVIVSCKSKTADTTVVKKLSNTCCIFCIRKSVSKMQLNTCFDAEFDIFLQQIFKNVLYCCRLLFSFLQLQFSYFLSLSLSEQKRDSKQNTVLNNKIVAFCLRVKTVAKKITAQKQIAAAKAIFAAQKLQLQNLTIDNIYISASIISVNSITLLSCTVETVFELNIFAAIFSSILRCYLNNIFYNRLDIKNIIKFTVDFFFVAITDAFDSSDTKKFLNLICVFNIYIFIAFSFVLYLTIK